MVLSVKLEAINHRESRHYDDLDFIDHTGNLKMSRKRERENLIGFKSNVIYFDNIEHQMVGIKYDSYNDRIYSEPLSFLKYINSFNYRISKFKTIVIETIEDEPLSITVKKATLFALIKAITFESNITYGYFNTRTPVERIATYYKLFIWHIEPMFRDIIEGPLEQLFYSEDKHIMKVCGVKSYR